MKIPPLIVEENAIKMGAHPKMKWIFYPKALRMRIEAKGVGIQRVLLSFTP